MKGIHGLAAVAMLATLGGLDDHYPRAKNQLDEIDIEAEYKLIQQKKSTLSRAKREWVLWTFEQKQKDTP